MYVSTTDLRLVNPASGSAVIMHAGVPRVVPPAFVELAISLGAVGIGDDAVGAVVEVPSAVEEEVEEVEVEVEVEVEEVEVDDPMATLEEPEDEEVELTEQEIADERIEKVADAMREILHGGELYKLTSSGCPRATEVEALVDFGTDKDMRDAAWAIIEG